MANCPNCKLKKTRWATTRGFVIGNKTYCCMGCGFSGCLCIDTRPSRQRKSHISLASVPK